MTERMRLPKPDCSSALKSWGSPALAAVFLVRAIGGVEVALADKEGDEPLLVLGGQRHVERVLIDGLRHQLAGVADHVGLHFAQPDALAASGPMLVPRSRSTTTRSR